MDFLDGCTDAELAAISSKRNPESQSIDINLRFPASEPSIVVLLGDKHIKRWLWYLCRSDRKGAKINVSYNLSEENRKPIQPHMRRSKTYSTFMPRIALQNEYRSIRGLHGKRSCTRLGHCYELDVDRMKEELKKMLDVMTDQFDGP
jgi:hypothetical protein